MIETAREKLGTKQILRDFEWAKMTDTNVMDSQMGQSPDAKKMNEMELIGHGTGLMTDTQTFADNIIITIEDTKHSGTDTLVTMRQQTQQIERVHDKAFAIENTLERTTYIVKRMIRRLGTDRYLWALIFLIIIAVIVIVLIKIRNANRVINNHVRQV